jgi:signal transduction histidine kinase
VTETTRPSRDPAPVRFNLSLRLLAFTVLFVMISEVLIYVPSISRYRRDYLRERIAAAHLATLALEAAPQRRVSPALEAMLLDHAEVEAIELMRRDAQLMLGRIPPVEARFHLDGATPYMLIRDAFASLAHGGRRHIEVMGTPPRAEHGQPPTRVVVYLDEGPLYAGMIDYSWRILTLSIVISLITAALLYLILQWMMVRPLRRITRNLVAFRDRPEDAARIIEPSRRSDEVGVLERELSLMQGEVRDALAQQARLAALGTAVSKINHDLRNILSTAQLVSERLARLSDPTVQKVAPMLIKSIDHAVQLCTQTLDLARGERATPERQRLRLRPLVEEAAAALELSADGPLQWSNRIPDRIQVHADHQRLYRLFLNLLRNAVQALGTSGRISVDCRPRNGRLEIDIADDGPGIPAQAREHLFQPFAGSASSGGTGLGLATWPAPTAGSCGWCAARTPGLRFVSSCPAKTVAPGGLDFRFGCLLADWKSAYVPPARALHRRGERPCPGIPQPGSQR